MDGPRGTAAVTGGILLLCLVLLAVFTAGELGFGVSSGEPLTVTVRRGESLSALSRRMHEEGLLAHPRFFQTLAILRGDAQRIKAGQYTVGGNLSAGELIRELVSGSSRMFSFTIPEGYSLPDIAAKLERDGVGNAATFLRLAKDPEFIARLDLPLAPDQASLEGLIFPETYSFAAGTQEAGLIRVMVAEFNRRAAPALQAKAASVGLSAYAALTLASIIEKETGAAFERKLISAVFHNRLKAKMRLSSDPTVIYGIESFNGNLTRRHLETPTPYNTYRMRGLPPTPIANPGLDSVLAALGPADVDYLYFVSKGDGTHHFSKTYRAHSRAVWRYQKRPHRRRKS